MSTVISAHNLGKEYTIIHKEAPYQTLSESIVRGVRSLTQGRQGNSKNQEKFWALHDVSFEVKQGQRVGIVGRNGAGKSTLLKVLSRITEPTKGRVSIQGRVSSLLEVGTGFHPELTGRENIFLNGSILGMSRLEIQRKFDEIVSFAEVEKFLDTPVKRYSSGMYVRLAFAVAAHLEPEILIIDEVLAVGDAQFQQKCLGKMEDVGKDGRTVIVVSHNMGLIKQLCTTGIFLKKGSATPYENVDHLIAAYFAKEGNEADAKTIELAQQKVRFRDAYVNGRSCSEEAIELLSEKQFAFHMEYDNDSGTDYDLCVSIALKERLYGNRVFYTHNHLENVRHKMGKSGEFNLSLATPKISPGEYTIEIQIWLDGVLLINEQEICDITLLPTPSFASQINLPSFPSILQLDSDWSFKKN